jgi:hypothetical protein
VLSGDGFGSALGLISTIVLIALLVQYELAAVAGERLVALARCSLVAMAPLAVVFILTVISRWPG